MTRQSGRHRETGEECHVQRQLQQKLVEAYSPDSLEGVSKGILISQRSTCWLFPEPDSRETVPTGVWVSTEKVRADGRSDGVLLLCALEDVCLSCYCWAVSLFLPPVCVLSLLEESRNI